VDGLDGCKARWDGEERDEGGEMRIIGGSGWIESDFTYVSKSG
jgi:hypothetical protein